MSTSDLTHFYPQRPFTIFPFYSLVINFSYNLVTPIYLVAILLCHSKIMLFHVESFRIKNLSFNIIKYVVAKIFSPKPFLPSFQNVIRLYMANGTTTPILIQKRDFVYCHYQHDNLLNFPCQTQCIYGITLKISINLHTKLFI